MSNFKAFEFGIRIAPGYASDPGTGKIGEIYWNTTRNVLRVCTATTPVWQDLFLDNGTTNDATLRWDSTSGKYAENTNFLVSSNRAYSPSGATGIDLEFKSGDSSGAGNNGADIKLIGGAGGAGGDQGKVFIDSDLISSIDKTVARSLTLKAGDTLGTGVDGGNLTLKGGIGNSVLGDKEVTEVTFRADVNGDLSNTYFFVNTPYKEFYCWFNSETAGVAQDRDVTINDNGAALATAGAGLFWNISSPTEDFYVWYNTGTESDPSATGTGIEVTVDAANTTAQIAEKTVAPLEGAGFTASFLSNVLTVVNGEVGAVTAATAGTTSSTFSINTYGYDKAEDPEIAGKVGVAIPFSLNDTNTTIATNASTAISNGAGFGIGPGPNPEDLWLTCPYRGIVAAPTDVNVGGSFSVSTLTSGTDTVGFDGDSEVIGGKRIDLTAEKISLGTSGTNDPLDAVEGDIYFNSTWKRFRKYANSEWSWFENSGLHTQIAKIDYKDDTLTSLPADTATIVDGATISDGDIILFTNLLVGYDKIYQASVVGITVTWSLIGLGQDELGLPVSGDIVYVTSGNTNSGSLFKYDGSGWVFFGSDLVELSNQNRGITVVGGGSKIWNSSTSELSWSEDFYIQVPGLDDSNNTILEGSVILSGNSNVAYVEINRTGGGTLTPVVADINTIPTNATSGTNIVIFARRVGFEIIWGTGNTKNEETEIFNEVTLVDDSAGNITVQPVDIASIIHYSMSRGANFEVGTLYLMSDGTNATVAGNDGAIGDMGVTFNAQVNGSNVELNYVTTSSGDNATIRFKSIKVLNV